MNLRMLPETITRWTAQPSGYGQTFGGPEHIRARWEDRRELVQTGNREEITSRAVVMVDRDVEVGDYLYRGETDEADPTTLSGAYEVRDFRKPTDLRNLQVNRKAIL